MCESNHKDEMKTRAMWKSAAPACLSRRYRCCAWFFVVRIDTSIPANTHLHAPIRYVLRSTSCLIGEVSLAINKRCATLSGSSSCGVSADCCEFFLALLIRWRYCASPSFKLCPNIGTVGANSCFVVYFVCWSHRHTFTIQIQAAHLVHHLKRANCN